MTTLDAIAVEDRRKVLMETLAKYPDAYIHLSNVAKIGVNHVKPTPTRTVSMPTPRGG
jgi:hypothetical protein